MMDMMDLGFIVTLVAILILVAAIALILRRAMRMKRSRANSPDGGYAMSSEYSEETTTVTQPEEEGLYEQEQLIEEETPSFPLPSGGAVPLTQRLRTQGESILQLKPGTAKRAIEVTVEELNAAYEADEVVADANLRNKTVEVTGVVDRLVANKFRDLYYIILSSAAGKEQWNVRCTFEKKDEAELNRLIKGQTVKVQGKYIGYRLNIILSECVLVG